MGSFPVLQDNPQTAAPSPPLTKEEFSRLPFANACLVQGHGYFDSSTGCEQIDSS